MHAMVRLAESGILLFVAATLIGCREHVTESQCDELVQRFAELVVQEKMPAAPPEAIHAEQARERAESASDDNFRNCTSELRVAEYRCAMAAGTAEALLQCLE
jgi:hypothetical protein